MLYADLEYQKIVKHILDNDEFKKTKSKIHHGIRRYDHLLRVSYYSYIITKKLRLNYKETARAGLLHDFFLEEVENENKINKLQKHPIYALNNAKKYFELTDREEDIIKTHMFPVTFTPPKYLESWIVDIVDDAVGIYEQYKSSCKEFKHAVSFLLVLLINVIQK